MKASFDNLGSAENATVAQAWDATSRVLNPDSVGYSTAEDDFRGGYEFAQHNGGYHFEGEHGQDTDLFSRVLAVHNMWTQTANTPNSAARVLGMLAALNAQMNQAQGGNA